MEPLPVTLVPTPSSSNSESIIGLLGALAAAAGFTWWYIYAGLFTCWIGKLAYLFLILPVMYCGWCATVIVISLIMLWSIVWCFCKFVFSYSIYDITMRFVLSPIMQVLYTSGDFIRDNIVPFLSQF